jgi:hypothetical protein
MHRSHYYGRGNKSLCGYEFSRQELRKAQTRHTRYVNCITCKRILTKRGVDN